MKDDNWFDYVDLGTGPRALKVNLNLRDITFDSTTYDRYHGAGAAEKAITDLYALYAKVESTSFSTQ